MSTDPITPANTADCPIHGTPVCDCAPAADAYKAGADRWLATAYLPDRAIRPSFTLSDAFACHACVDGKGDHTPTCDDRLAATRAFLLARKSARPAPALPNGKPDFKARYHR